jgi:hypothetical protein
VASPVPFFRITLRACSRGPGHVMNRPVPLAKEIVLQVAVKDIGQLTDI